MSGFKGGNEVNEYLSVHIGIVFPLQWSTYMCKNLVGLTYRTYHLVSTSHPHRQRSRWTEIYEVGELFGGGKKYLLEGSEH